MASFDEFHDLVQKENPETIAQFYEQFFTNKVADIRTIIKMAEEKGFTFSAEEAIELIDVGCSVRRRGGYSISMNNAYSHLID